jgi:hypothetical protein
MDHEVVASRHQHREIVHRSLENLHVDPAFAGHLAIEGEHGWREIDDGHLRARRRIERTVFAAAGGEAEHLQPIEPVGQPTAARRSAAAEPRAWIGKRPICRGPRKGRPTLGQPVPGPGIVVEHEVADRLAQVDRHDDVLFRVEALPL